MKQTRVEHDNEQVEETLRAASRRPEKSISFYDFEGLLKALGFEHLRTKGSHRRYVHRDAKAIMTINPFGKDSHRYQRELLLEFVEQYGLHIKG